MVAWRCVGKTRFFLGGKKPILPGSLTVSLPLKIYKITIPKGKDRLPTIYHFSGAMLNFKGVDFGLLLQRYPD